MVLSPYFKMREELVLGLLDKFPDHPTRTLARILYRDNPSFFKDFEDARDVIRYRRGQRGAKLRTLISTKNKKYVREQSI